MTLTDDVHLPSDEELKHKEIPLTHNYFISSAMWLGKYCDHQCKEFMLCRTEEMDPRKCLNEGHEVTDCGLKFFKKVKKSCPDELEWYTKCLDHGVLQPEFRRCRNEQALFDECMYNNGFERARFGHFQLLRVHKTDRPRPKPYVPIFPDAVPTVDIDDPKFKGKPTSGSSPEFLWQTWLD